MATYFGNIVCIDYSAIGLKPVEQLVFLKLSYALSDDLFDSVTFSINYICELCNCTKPTVISSLAKLESLGLISIQKTPGSNNSYSLNKPYVESLFRFETEQANWLGETLEDLFEPDSIPKQKIKPQVNKNKRKRDRKRKRRK